MRALPYALSAVSCSADKIIYPWSEFHQQYLYTELQKNPYHVSFPFGQNKRKKLNFIVMASGSTFYRFYYHKLPCLQVLMDLNQIFCGGRLHNGYSN